eukprot:CAMPEP_0117425662 /NCGR_PEP_ID=MMETSP0758-20121206/5913_1 /TAXON_ID=63605 /ORGANISM="Percolomonas cosmopolitus, Strain AE-1 (ATCC 50343)" /LENGTH=145 /DNA_ID=CAMNT_0005210329 /DNA_START=316 /DNA_END=753 /DNA_ORIENTATION=-
MHLEAISHIFEESESKTQNHRERYIKEMEILKEELTHYEEAEKSRAMQDYDLFNWLVDQRIAMEKEIQQQIGTNERFYNVKEKTTSTSADQILDNVKMKMDQYLESMDQMSDTISESIQEQVNWIKQYHQKIKDDHDDENSKEEF